MKSSTKDQADGKFHNVKGMVKEMAGNIIDNPKLEGDGAAEKIAGKVQEKIGQVEKVLGEYQDRGCCVLTRLLIAVHCLICFIAWRHT